MSALPSSPTPTTPFCIQTRVTPYFTREPLADGRVLAYRFTRVDREAADAWYEDVTQLIWAWPAERRYCSLLDLHGKEHLISASAYSRARQVTYVRAELGGRVAFLINKGIIAPVMNTLIRNAVAGASRQRLLFSSEEAALAWLLSPS